MDKRPFALKYGMILRVWLLFCLVFPVSGYSEQTKPWFTDSQMARLYEALVAFQENGIFASDRLQADTEVLSAYLSTKDPFARLYSAEQYEAYLKSLSPEYGGVEMEIQLTPEENIICRPFPGGIAEQAGIRSNDRLLAVDGRPLSDNDLLMIGSAIRGPAGTQVQLTIRSGNRPDRTVTVTRVTTRMRSVSRQHLGRFTTLRLHRFTAETPIELRDLLMRMPTTDPLILDLRDNPGGDLDGAIEAASLFVPFGKEVVTLLTNTTTRLRRSSATRTFTFPAVILLQNRQTASSAEVFLGALVQNRIAISLGETSYGKGVAQQFVRLTDGSAMLLSFAKLLPPNKMVYHLKGLVPTIVVQKENPDDTVLDLELEKLLSSQLSNHT